MMWIQPYDFLNSPIDAIGYQGMAAGPANRAAPEPGGKFGWNETTQPADIVAKADSLYSQASITTDSTQRIALLQELDIQLLQYGPTVGLCQATNHVAYNAHLTGVFWGPKNIFSSIWFIQWTS
jgi:ABC-type transport system substrate-binding protein